MFVQRKCEIGVFGQRLQAEPAHLIDRILADRANGTWHDGDAVPSGVGAPVEIESAGVLKRLAARDECAQVPHFRVTGNRTDASIRERLE